MKKVATGALVAAALAAPAAATIGSIISSFDYTASSRPYGILAQPNNIYLSGYIIYGNYIVTYTRTGSLVGSTRIDPGNVYYLHSGSRTHLGPGYIALIDQNTNRLKIFSIASGGAPVASFAIRIGSWNVFWDGNYYYVNATEDQGRFTRYSSSGGYSGGWICAGWPSVMTECRGAEYAQCGNNASGPYFLAGAGYSDWYCMTTFPGGSLVATWRLGSPYLTHMSYGDSSNPGVYGATIWATTNSRNVREIDIDARNAAGILPASLGKIKAIFR